VVEALLEEEFLEQVLKLVLIEHFVMLHSPAEFVPKSHEEI